MGDVSSKDTSAYDNEGWLQDGYLLGSTDGKTSTSDIVYAENNDLNSDGPVAHLDSSLNLGNRLFTVYWTGETGENGRGLYEAYYGESLDYLAQAWLINPMYTLQEALAEGYLGDSSGWCPEFNYGFFGTNGQISNLTWDSTTELYIYNNTPAEVLLSPSNVATHNYTDSPPLRHNHLQFRRRVLRLRRWALE